MARMKFRPVVDDREMSQEEREARWELWRMGDLSWKLHECQLPIYDELTSQEDSQSVALCARRFGKSFIALIGEIEACIQNPLIICKHACPTQKMVKEMIYPQLRIIFHDAPPELSLDKLWRDSEGKLIFPNHSFIGIAGTDGNNADNLRGTYCHIATCDEAAFMDNLSYVVYNILRPQLLTTGGKLNMLSTPNPRILDHEFHTKFVYPAEASGKLKKFTIWDNKRLTPEQIKAEIAAYPLGEEDPMFKVEYLVEIPKSTELSVLPEFYMNKAEIITEEDMSIIPYCDTYVSGDVGVKDLTAYLFAYYDFKKATLYVMDEWVMNGLNMTTEDIAGAIKIKEELHFTYPNGRRLHPMRRVMDNDLKLITDLNRLHGINFMATKKDNKAAAVNEVKLMFHEGRIKIHPRCKHLIYHCEHAQWKKNAIGREFDRLPDSIDGSVKGGHVDTLDALVYLVRNILYNHNPYPETNSILNEDQHHHTGTVPSASSSVSTMVKRLFGIKRN